jgi:MarR family transcriptional regulator, lower aerobic nicotinate degradation pathway regulator
MTATELSTLLAGLGREVTARVRRAIRPLGLGAQQYLVLSQLDQLGQTSQAELAAALGLDASNLATVAGDLVELGLIDRTRVSTDRRRYALKLTPSGENLLAKADDAIAATERDLLGPLSDTQSRQLRTLLRRVADPIDLCPSADDPTCADNE